MDRSGRPGQKLAIGLGIAGAALGAVACGMDAAVEPTGEAVQPITLTAFYDTGLKAPACWVQASGCDSGMAVQGRGPAGIEPSAPNTIHSDCPDGSLGIYHADESLDRLVVSTIDGAPLTAGGTARIDATVWVFSAASDRLDLYYAPNASSPVWSFLATLTPPAIGQQTLSTTYVLPAGALQAIRGQFRYGGSPGTCTSGGYNDRDDLAFTVAANDNPPSTAITAPAPGLTVSATIGITATASDDLGIAKVEFYRDATVLIGTATSAPYQVTWNSGTVPDGPHTITSKAVDTSQNTATSTVAISVLNADATPPAARLDAPAPGAIVSGVAALRATATDNLALARVEFYVDAALVGTATVAPYALAWDSTSVPPGAHVISCAAYDVAGNRADSAAVPVTVYLDTTPPTTSITSPSAGATLSGIGTVTADATDDLAVSSVEFYRDGTILLGTTQIRPYAITWNTATAPDGAHTLTSKAYDAAGHSATSAPLPVTIANLPPPAVTAIYDAALGAPRCTAGRSCSSGTLLDGSGTAEAHTPNLIGAACPDGIGNRYHVDESLDRLVISTLDGSALSPGKQVRIDATVWAYSLFMHDSLDLFYTGSASTPTWSYLGTLTPFQAGAQTLSATYVLPPGTLQAIRGQFRFGATPAMCQGDPYDDRDDLVFATP